MRLFIGFICFLFYTNISAQEGFIKSYDFYEDKGFGFHHLLLQEDTIIAFGSFSNPDIPQWGIFFGKIDTLGNILEYKTHYLDEGYNTVFTDGAKVIQTSDGGYAMIGANHTLSHLMLFKLDVNGNKEFFREYPDTTTFQDWHRDIVEFEHGYIYVGAKQQMDDGLNDAFAMRLDKEGNVVWEIDYGDIDIAESFTGVRQLGDNEFLLTGGRQTNTFTTNPDENAWFNSLALTIDTLGNITSEWQGEEVSIGTGLRQGLYKLHLTPDNNWMHISATDTIGEIIGESTLLSRPTFVKRDTNFNVLWEKPILDFSNTSGKNRFIDLKPTPDSGWVAVGSYSNILNYDTYEGYRTGLITKINSEGNRLWCRIDTVLTPSYGAKPKLESVVVLPSGSIIAAGQADRLYPEPAKSFGWLIKVDKHGCIEPGCNPTTNLIMTSSVIEFKVFPNPTSDYLNIEGQGDFEVKIFGIGGRQFLYKHKYSNSANIDITTLPKGIYFVQIRQGNHYLTKKIIKE